MSPGGTKIASIQNTKKKKNLIIKCFLKKADIYFVEQSGEVVILSNCPGF